MKNFPKKTVTAVILTAFLLLSLCGCKKENTDKTASDDRFKVEYGVLTVHLPANATTGYEWLFNIGDESVAELITHEYINKDTYPDMVGVGGTYAASFRGLKKGETQIDFGYARQWDPENSADSLSLMLTVDEDKNIVSAKEIK